MYHMGRIIWFILESQHSFHYGNSEFSFSGLFKDFYWLADFWFLKSCFICYLLAFIGIKSKARKSIWMTTTLIISQAISPFSVSFLYPCFLIGMEMKQNKQFFCKILLYRYFFSLLFLIMLLFWNQDMWVRSHGIPHNISFAGIEEWGVLLFSRLYRLFIGTIGSLAVISVLYNSFKSLKSSKITTIFSEWGKYTLQIYILQNIVLEKGISQYVNLSHVNSVLFNSIIAPMASVFILLICIMIIKIIQKSYTLNKLLWNPYR